MRENHRCARNNHCAHRQKITPPPTCDQCQCHAHGAGHPCSIDGGCGHLHDTNPRLAGVYLPTPAGLCETCTQHVTQALRQLPMDYVELDTIMATTGTFMSEMVVSSRELPIPIRVSIDTLQRAITHEAEAWVEPLAEQLGIRWDTQQARDSRPGHSLQRASRILAHSVPALLMLPEQTYRHHSEPDLIDRDGLDGALELLWLHDLVRIVAGRNALTHRLPAPCPACGGLTLVRLNGADHVECERCHDRWTEDDYRRLCLVLASDYTRAVA